MSGLRESQPYPRVSGRERIVSLPEPAERHLSFDQAAPVAGATRSERLRRALNVVLALIGIAVALPVMVVVAILIKLTSRGPVFFRQKRKGIDGHEFEIYKFRSMKVHEEVAGQVTQAKKNDSRVTPVGRFLRRTSLDELPQFINVLKGEMSLVGPRPVVQAELDHYGPSARHYLAARPGLTGLWQISGRSDTTYAERVRLDRFYVMNWNLWRDLRIIFLTIPAVALSRGAH